MPTKTYMVVDVRRDHSFRVPRPDLSVALSTPNACTQCHSAEWAAQTVAGWFPGGRPTIPHYGTTIWSCRRRRALPEAEKEYRRALCLDPSFMPALVNLADLDRARGTDAEGEKLLREAMTIEPDNADVNYALGSVPAAPARLRLRTGSVAARPKARAG